MMKSKTPITLITGSLGSGKTTLLRHILDRTDRRLAVLMNEFGEIAIDSRVIEGEHIRIVELVGGCVCCELAGEFEAAVEEIIEKIQPEQIIVEATGVAEADALAFEVEENLPRVRLDSVICIVDAFASVKYPQIGHASRTHLRAADIVLLNKVDLVDPNSLDVIESSLRGFNDRALLFRTERCGIDTGLLFGSEVRRNPVPVVGHEKSGYQSFTFSSDLPMDQARFKEVVSGFPPAIYRAKGFVRCRDETFLFNYVAGRMDLEPHPAERTELVFIGHRLDEVREEIRSRLTECCV